MQTRIYHEEKFGIIIHGGEKVTIKVNDNNSLLYSHESVAFHIQEKYENLEDLLKDGSIGAMAKWLARGLLGIPLGEPKI